MKIFRKWTNHVTVRDSNHLPNVVYSFVHDLQKMNYNDYSHGRDTFPQTIDNQFFLTDISAAT